METDVFYISDLGSTNGTCLNGTRLPPQEEHILRDGDRVGLAVDLETGAGLEATARAQATAEGVPDREAEVLALARVALESPVVKRAVSSGHLWREVPVAAPLEGGIVEGFIDLLFEQEDGLVIVDYKTDALGVDQTADAANRYRIQGGAYTLALQQVTGKPVKEVVFLFLPLWLEEVLSDVSMLQAEANAAASAFLAKGVQTDLSD